MVFKPSTQYQMPSDPAGPLQVVTKQYSDAGDATRAPATHAAQHASGGSDPVTPAAIGAVQGVSPTATKTANYPAAIGELVMADATNGAFTVTLPTITANGQRVGIKRLDATAANLVTVAAASGNTIGTLAAASIPIRLQDQAAVFQAFGSNWVIANGYQSLTSLDARYPLTTDSRLSDARTPTAHKTSHATGGTDALAPSDIGAPALSTVTAKGDLLVATGSAVLARQAVGSNGQVLVADSTQTAGVRWSGPVITAPRTQSVSANVSIDCASPGDLDITLTASATLTVLTSGPVPANGRVCVVTVLSSGGAFTPTLSGPLLPDSGGPTSLSLALTSGKLGLFVLRWVGLRATPAWLLTSAEVCP